MMILKVKWLYLASHWSPENEITSTRIRISSCIWKSYFQEKRTTFESCSGKRWKEAVWFGEFRGWCVQDGGNIWEGCLRFNGEFDFQGKPYPIFLSSVQLHWQRLQNLNFSDIHEGLTHAQTPDRERTYKETIRRQINPLLVTVLRPLGIPP